MINTFLELIGIAVIAIFAENVVFTGGFSSCQLIRATKRPKQIIFFGGMVTAYELLSIMFIYPLDRMLSDSDWSKYARFMLFPLVVSVIYIVSVLIVRSISPDLFRILRKTMIKAAFNCVVLGIPFVVSLNQSSVATAAFGSFGYVFFYALGAGIGFILAAWLVYEAVDKISNPDIPKAFVGLPSLLIYIGILSLAFFGFGGRSLY